MFCEREQRQYDFFADLPAADVLNRGPRPRPDSGDVQTRVVTRQIADGHPQVKLKILLQHLHQGRVETRFVLMCFKREAGPGASAVQRHR